MGNEHNPSMGYMFLVYFKKRTKSEVNGGDK